MKAGDKLSKIPVRKQVVSQTRYQHESRWQAEQDTSVKAGGKLNKIPA
jgi:hypothetical protein